jgi:peptidoglycan hydrolase FlgJ
MADGFPSSTFMTQALASQSAKVPNVAGVRTEAQAEQVAKEFESFFLGQYIQGMFAGIKSDGPFGGGAGEKAFSGLLQEEYAKVFAQNGGIGLSDQLKAEILRMQGIESQKGQK